MPKLRHWVKRIEEDLGMELTLAQRNNLKLNIEAIQKQAVGAIVDELERMVASLREDCKR